MFQHLRCIFHFFSVEKVESVKIKTEKPMHNGHTKMKLNFSPEENHWISPELFIPPDQHDKFQYQYVVKCKQGIVKRLLNKVTFGGNDEKTFEEAKTCKLKSSRDQYDIFCNPREKNWIRTIFQGKLFYVKWLYQKLSRGGSLTEMLIESERVGFAHPDFSKKDIEIFLKWVVQSTGKNLFPYQCVYLCSLLGQFLKGMNASPAEYCGMLEKECIDNLLSKLKCYSSEALPESSTAFIKIVAKHLFECGSSKGYLIFIKTFCNLLDLEYVIQVADTLSPKSYTGEQFDRQVPGVLESLNLVKDFESRQTFFSYVIKHAPSVKCLWNLYDAMLQWYPDLLNILEEEFTAVYLTFTSPQRARKPDFLQPCFWSAVPEKLKDKLASKFCEVLFQQISSQTTSIQGRLGSLRSIALDPRLQSADAFCRLIVEISSQKPIEVVSMVLILLKSEAFLNCWHKRFCHEEKLKVSWNWIRSQSIDGKPSKHIIAVVKAGAIIRETDAMKTDKKLCNALEEKIDQMVLKEDFQSIIDAIADAQIGSTSILPRLVTLLRMAIKERSGTGDQSSRYRQMVHLLSCDYTIEREKILQKETLDR